MILLLLLGHYRNLTKKKADLVPCTGIKPCTGINTLKKIIIYSTTVLLPW